MKINRCTSNIDLVNFVHHFVELRALTPHQEHILLSCHRISYLNNGLSAVRPASSHDNLRSTPNLNRARLPLAAMALRNSQW
jgi:hypothetical protein